MVRQAAWILGMLVVAAAPRARGAEPPGKLTVVLRWETQGTDVDLFVTDPHGQRCAVEKDVTEGPGQETCVVAEPVPGDYRIGVMYAGDQGGQVTPVSVSVQLGGKALGVFKAVLARGRRFERIHTLTVPSPEDAVAVELTWATEGADVDLIVTDAAGRAHAAEKDATSGPGKETCVIPAPGPGKHQIAVHYFSDAGGKATPVSVAFRRGGKLVGTYKAELTKRGETRVVHTFTVAPPKGALVIELSWQTPTDVDLIVSGPNRRRYRPLRDILRGPGKETCIIARPGDEEIRIGARYLGGRGFQGATPVTVTVTRDGKLEGTYKAELTRRLQYQVIHTLGGPKVDPARAVTIELSWQTAADVDLFVIDPRGRRLPPRQDILRGPGKETVVIGAPAPGEYKIAAVYFNPMGVAETAVTVEVRRGGRLVGTYRASLTRPRQRILVHTYTHPKAGAF